MIGWIIPVDLRLDASSASDASLNWRRGWWGLATMASRGISARGLIGRGGDVSVGADEEFPSAGMAGSMGGASSGVEREIRLLKPRPRRDLDLVALSDMAWNSVSQRRGRECATWHIDGGR